MLKYLGLAVMLFSGCATLTGSSYSHCGQIGSLSVSRQDGYLYSCKEVMDMSSKALRNLETEGLTVREPWQLTYVWTRIDVSNPRAQTIAGEHTIKIRQPEGVIHELLHAHLDEIGRLSHQHSIICANGWDRLDRDFGVDTNYCGLASAD